MAKGIPSADRHGLLRRRPTLAGFLLGAAGTLAVMALSFANLMQALELKAYDRFFQLRPAIPMSDRILMVDGKTITSNQQTRELIGASKGRPLAVVVQRKESRLTLTMTPKKQGKRYIIGIGFDYKLSFLKLTMAQTVLAAIAFPIDKSMLALGNLKALFTGQVGVDQMGGPVAIVRQLKLSFDSGLVTALTFMALLNVLLGIFNLLPLPALDGGRLIFLSFTLVTRRQVNQRVENAVHMVGFIILLGLLLLTFGDTAKLIKESGKQQTITTP